MSNFYGADVEQLRALGREIQAQSDELLAIAGRLSQRVSDTGVWRGPDGERFRSDWQQRHAVAIRSAANALAAASDTAVRNAEEQSQTSGGSSSSGAFGSGSPVPGVPGLTITPDGWINFPPGVTPADLFDEMGRLIDTKIPGSPWSYQDIGQFVPGISDAFDIMAYGDSIAHGEVPFHEIVGTIGSEMRSAGFEAKSPVLYLGGVAIGVWDTAAQKAIETDWSAETFDNTMSFIKSDPLDAIDAAGEAIVEFFPDLISNFKFW